MKKRFEITPYKSFGNLNFADNLEKTIEKLGDFKIHTGSTKFMGNSCQTVHVNSLELHITFKQDSQSIECFETSLKTIVYNDLKLLDLSFEELKKIFKDEQFDIIEDIDGFRVEEIGIGFNGDLNNGKLSKRPKSLIVYSKGHYSDSNITSKDIINYYLGKNGK